MEIDTDVHEVFIKQEINSDIFTEEDLCKDNEMSKEFLLSQQCFKSKSQAYQKGNEEALSFKLEGVKQELPNKFLNIDNVDYETKRDLEEKITNDQYMNFETVIVSQHVKVEYDVGCCDNIIEESRIFPNEQRQESEDNFDIKCPVSFTNNKANMKGSSGLQEQFSGILFPCTYCGLAFSSTLDKSRHEQICKNNNHSNDDLTYKYEVSGENFQKENDVHKPIVLPTREKSLLCELCNKTFTRRNSMWRHIKSVHNKQISLQCDLCDKIVTIGNLKQHNRLHSGDKHYSCDMCEKKFTFLCELKKHLRFHTGYKPYSCNTCDKKFGSASDLTRHERLHTGEKPYSCNTCEKKFSSSGALTIHIRSHTGEKPFSCPLCDKKFAQSSQCLQHKKLHSGKKPFSCNICCMEFARSNNLQGHMMIHSGEKPFFCTKCDKKFSGKSVLIRHMKSHAESKS